MGLHVHDRKQALHPVDAAVVDALAQTYFSDGPAAAPVVGRAQDFLTALRQAQQWLACDCRGADPAGAPMLAPRWPKDAAIHLLRFGEHEHAPDCVFGRRMRVPVAPNGAHGAGSGQSPADPPWNLRPYLDDPTRLTARLGQILRAALARARMGSVPADVLEKGPHGTSRRTDGLPEARLQQAIAPITLDDGLTYGAAGLRLLRRWRAFGDTPIVRQQAARPDGFVGLWIGLVAGVEVGVQPGQPSQLRLPGSAQAQGEPPEAVSIEQRIEGVPPGTFGPFWAAVALRRARDDSALHCLAASVLPALDVRTGVPLLRAADRAHARLLLHQAFYWRSWSGTQCAVELDFPIFDGLSAGAVIVLPNGRKIEAHFVGSDPHAGAWGDGPEPVYCDGVAPKHLKSRLSAAVAKGLKETLNES